MKEKLNSFINHPQVHFTYSEKKLLSDFIPEICLKNGLSINDFFKNQALLSILNSKTDPVQKGKKVYAQILKMRYPLSGGKSEPVIADPTLTSSGVRALNSKKKLINPYYYGEEVFNLKEHVLSLIRSCPLDCAYCFLREVYDESRLKIPPNYGQIQTEMGQLRKEEEGVLYINAGENADSLILDLEFGLTQKLWQIIEPFPDVFIEFRSKTNKIQNLLKVSNHQKRIVTAFSLNSEEDRNLFESTTAAIGDRISAISELQKAGFVIGLRFEPIVYTKNYEENYKRLFEKIFTQARPEQIHSVAFGCLRLTKGLAKMLRKSHPAVLAEEWILGKDKKLRYYKGIRIELYQKLIELLKPYFQNQEKMVLSTEPPEIWTAANLSLKTMPQICQIL